ncbi:efflux RND transporter periplasmic adaptor subunit [Xylophilus sp. ASV27]|uniref:efflux RND transporter periplasmic adaptor subunit n=1 Tax=Xylophilus sp. ASV27 TaxID=2795129 RepID=UPI001E3BB7A0|nr:efflux RND transporter periplasmic adaptor subunit [Xylophilus sp. ASV27]
MDASTSPTPIPQRARRGLPILLALLVLLAAAALYLRHRWAGAPPAAATPPVPVTTVAVARKTVPIALRGVGSVLPIHSVAVHTRVDGQLESVGFTEGQDVKAGQVLARIDPRTYQAQLAQAMAQKAKDTALLANARADLARYDMLIKEDATTRQTLDTQKSLVNQLQAALQTDEAQINYAQVQLDYTTITAPISGRAGARLVDPGNIVHAADASGLVVINQIDPVAVQFTLPESSFQAVNRALRASREPLQVMALTHDTQEVLGTGRLVLLNNQIDTSTGTIALKAHFPNAGRRLWPGQSVDTRITLGERSEVLVVPSAVVQRSQDGYFAYVVGADGTVQPRQVDVVDTSEGQAVIGKGLDEGERVVLEGQYRLRPGAHVAEHPPKAAAPAAAAGARP